MSFVRAMDLYGVSLRKGETPDEISRTGVYDLIILHTFLYAIPADYDDRYFQPDIHVL